MSYTVKLKQFEGPFDLLLFFIERDELDINDIPIASMTHDFLEYIRQMEALNIDVASEFILVAATLMRIKSKMLLPRRETDEAGREIDPREELVERLLEYKKYKSVLEELRNLESTRAQSMFRGNVSDELQTIANKSLVDIEMESVTLFKLLKAFQRVMERFVEEKREHVHRILRYNYSVHEEQDMILLEVQQQGKLSFREMFAKCVDRMHAIVIFSSNPGIIEPATDICNPGIRDQ